MKRLNTPSRRVSTRELVLRLVDELGEGIRYNRRRNVYELVWTARQLRAARRQAKRLMNGLVIE